MDSTAAPVSGLSMRLPRPRRELIPRRRDLSDLARARRIGLLIVAIVLMGAADLMCTLIYMYGIGMVEVNPIARRMVEINGATQLVMFKLLTMLLAGSALYLGRFHRRTEACGWGCTVLMLALTLHWVRYNRDVILHTNDIAVITMHEAPERWVTLPN